MFIANVHVLNGWSFLNQKANKNIQISYSLKYKHLKKNLYEKMNGSVGMQDEISFQWSSINQGSYGTINVRWDLYGTTFIKKSSCLVAAMTQGVSKTNSSFHVTAYNRKSLISIFQEFSSSINKTFILAGRLGTGLSFYGVQTVF